MAKLKEIYFKKIIYKRGKTKVGNDTTTCLVTIPAAVAELLDTFEEGSEVAIIVNKDTRSVKMVNKKDLID